MCVPYKLEQKKLYGEIFYVYLYGWRCKSSIYSEEHRLEKNEALKEISVIKNIISVGKNMIMVKLMVLKVGWSPGPDDLIPSYWMRWR